MQTKEFLESGQYLPECMRDPDGQNLLFRYINSIVMRKKEDPDNILLQRLPDWVSATIYTVDFFLWIMARHGYTLQKSRKHIDDFRDIEQDLADYQRYVREVGQT